MVNIPSCHHNKMFGDCTSAFNCIKCGFLCIRYLETYSHICYLKLQKHEHTPLLQIAVSKLMQPLAALHLQFQSKQTHITHQHGCHWPVLVPYTELLPQSDRPRHGIHLMQFALHWEHIPTSVSQSLSVLRTARLSVLISLLQHPHRPVWSLPPSQLTAARRRRGNPRSGLDSAMAVSASLFSPARQVCSGTWCRERAAAAMAR